MLDFRPLLWYNGSDALNLKNEKIIKNFKKPIDIYLRRVYNVIKIKERKGKNNDELQQIQLELKHYLH